MRVELENGKITPIINYLYDLKLVRKQSRYRRRLIKLLRERLEEYEEDRKELLEYHANKDENGKAIIKNGNYDVRDMVAFSHDLKELNEEKIVIEGGDNRELIRTIRSILLKYENEEYEGDESEIYDYLCEVFKVDEVEEESDETDDN